MVSFVMQSDSCYQAAEMLLQSESKQVEINICRMPDQKAICFYKTTNSILLQIPPAYMIKVSSKYRSKVIVKFGFHEGACRHS